MVKQLVHANDVVVFITFRFCGTLWQVKLKLSIIYFHIYCLHFHYEKLYLKKA